MADSPYGVYASFRLPGGQLVSSNRETVDELKADLEGILGAEGAEEFWGAFLARTEAPAPAAPAPVVQSAPAPVQSSPAPSSPSVGGASQAPGIDDLPANGFESCEKCGALKDVWKPGGVSQAGKSYPGFFSCPNWPTHK